MAVPWSNANLSTCTKNPSALRVRSRLTVAPLPRFSWCSISHSFREIVANWAMNFTVTADHGRLNRRCFGGPCSGKYHCVRVGCWIFKNKRQVYGMKVKKKNRKKFFQWKKFSFSPQFQRINLSFGNECHNIPQENMECRGLRTAKCPGRSAPILPTHAALQSLVLVPEHVLLLKPPYAVPALLWLKM